VSYETLRRSPGNEILTSELSSGGGGDRKAANIVRGLHAITKLLIALGAVVLLVTGCGGSKASESSGASDSQVSEAQSLVDAAKKKPTFAAPGPAVDGSVLNGKTIWVVTNVNVSQNTPIIAGIKQAASLLGAKVTVFDAAGKVPDMNRGMSQAVAAGADAILMPGIDPALTSEPLDKARAKGIPVVDAYGTSLDTKKLPGNFAHVSILFRDGGKLQADYLIAHSKGKPVNAVIFNDSEFASEIQRAQGMQQELKRLCPKCKFQVKDVQLAKVQTDLKTLTQNLLRKDPSINYLLADYDYQAQFIVPGVLASGAADKVFVISADAAAPNLDLVRKGQQLVDIGEPLTWSGWALVDEVVRAMNKKPAIDEKIPQRVLDKSNLPPTNDEAQMFGDQYIAGYKQLWGAGS
jgi:ribose transport system substrate-binding protein